MDGQVRNRMFLRELNPLIPELYTDWHMLMLQNLGGRTVRVSFAEERSPPQSYNDNHQGSRGFDN
jgi:hypothetical protein